MLITNNRETMNVALRPMFKGIIDRSIKKCSRCPGLNIPNITESAPGFGNIDSPVMFIGQSLCTACMDTQIPFTGGSGIILDTIFGRLGLMKKDIFITNLVHCHPPNNRPSKPKEIKRCRPYLDAEIMLVNPILIVGFGNDVKNAMFESHIPFNQGMRCVNGKYEGRTMIFFYHPAYYWRKGGLYSKETQQYIDIIVDYLRGYV